MGPEKHDITRGVDTIFDTILAKQMKEKSVFDNAVERPIEGSK